MEDATNYQSLNRKSWNLRTAAHWTGDFYDVKGFIDGKEVLKSIELNLLGDLSGKKILHLQCHFGQDSIALARHGAQVTGIDLSDDAIAKAIELADACGQSVKFICCDIYGFTKSIERNLRCCVYLLRHNWLASRSRQMGKRHPTLSQAWWSIHFCRFPSFRLDVRR